MCVNYVFLTLLLLISVVSKTTGSCHKIHENYFKYLATKTGYRFIQNEDQKPLNFPDCELTKIWGLVRHGTRLPGDKIIAKIKHDLSTLQEKIIDNYSQDKSNLCDISMFKSWTPHFELDGDDKSLTIEGQRELLALGQRLRNRFPTLLNQKFDNDTFFFKYTKTQRTQESAFRFVEGLFGREGSTEVWYPRSVKRDPILRFYKACEKWRHTVDHSPASYEEQEKFTRSKLYQQTVAVVSRRLGFERNLTAAEVKLMYTTCGFETAWSPGFESPWCSIFSVKDLEVLEYAEDIDYYWIDGHGYALTGKIACPAFQDMMNHISSTSARHTIFYFTHSGTLLKFLTHLSLYNDSSPLLHNNYAHMRERKWRVSRIDAFGTNLVFANYRCKNNRNYLLTLHQERPVLLPGCQEFLCPLETIQETYRTSLHECEFEQMCKYEGDGKSTGSLREENTDHDEL
uniref:Multiple inositol polyphosphate phosphatase 1 n=1 Tax=Cacopsylla melanoneura TaxID=428564 RepID=A0A8D8ZWM5_9HEMI